MHSALALLALSLPVIAAEAHATRIWRYSAGEDVSEHAKIDLDMVSLETLADAGAYDAAFALWAQGKHSFKSANVPRTLKGFSTALPDKSSSLLSSSADLLPEYTLFVNYFDNDPLYGTTYVESALNGTGDFAGLPVAARAEFIAKGAQYMVVHMYVVRYMYEALRACQEGQIYMKAWDEAVAFYTGSLIQPDGSGSGALLFSFAQKRCGAFGTCDASGFANANSRAFDAFVAGKSAVLAASRCEDILTSLHIVRKQMQIALVQGVLDYTLRSDAAISAPGNFKAMAEASAFLAALLPYIDAVDSAAAASLRAELELKTGVAQTVRGGYSDVFQTMYGVLPKLCMSCEEVGVNNIASAGAANIPVCVTDRAALDRGCAEYLRPLEMAEPGVEDEETDWGLILGLTGAGVFVAALVFAMVLRASGKRDDKWRFEVQHESSPTKDAHHQQQLERV